MTNHSYLTLEKLDVVFIFVMERSEAISLGPVGPDSCHSCSQRHTCGESSPPSVVATPVDVWEIDESHSGTCMRKILISCILALLILILVVVILRSIS